MKYRIQRKGIIVTSVFFAGLVGVCRAGEALDLVKSAGERAIAVLKDPKLKFPAKKKERVERLKEIINPIFDYDEMARRTLGAHWRRRTPAEQEEFARLFRAFLEGFTRKKLIFTTVRESPLDARPLAVVCSSGIDSDQRERRGELGGSLPTQTRRCKAEGL